MKRSTPLLLSHCVLTLLLFSDVSSALAQVKAKSNHVGLAVANLGREQKFFEDAFDMHIEQRFDLPNPPVHTVLLRNSSGLGIELIERQGATRLREYSDALDAASTLGYGHWALTVGDLDGLVRHLLNVGATLVSAPADAVQPGMRFAYVKDPEGNLIELIEPARLD
jgi:catechol 2,3-dioxygenase-like lactoylglutathione lyase family enzyme